jgi:rare lipoprotein A (peptidoglycan hydrolase)
LFVVPLLLLQSASALTSRSDAAARSAHAKHKGVVYPSSNPDGVNLPSNLVAYQAPPTTPTTAPATTTTAPPATTTTAPRPTTTTTAPPPPPPPPPPPTTTTTAAPAAAPAAANHESGQATWYAEAPAGMCASPTLPFGTMLTVVNNASGASTVCRVDDREGAGYPRVVDMSPEGFSQIADLGEGVVDVTISW